MLVLVVGKGMMLHIRIDLWIIFLMTLLLLLLWMAIPELGLYYIIQGVGGAVNAWGWGIMPSTVVSY